MHADSRRLLSRRAGGDVQPVANGVDVVSRAVQALPSVVDEATVVDLDAVEQLDEEDTSCQEFNAAAHSSGDVERVGSECGIQEGGTKAREQRAKSTAGSPFCPASSKSMTPLTAPRDSS